MGSNPIASTIGKLRLEGFIKAFLSVFLFVPGNDPERDPAAKVDVIWMMKYDKLYKSY